MGSILNAHISGNQKSYKKSYKSYIDTSPTTTREDEGNLHVRVIVQGYVSLRDSGEHRKLGLT